jgi:hypothetical protein
MSRPSSPFLAAIWLAATGYLITAPIPARSQQSEQQFDFDIPSRPLDSALAEYFKITGVQLLVDSTISAGQRSRAVRGLYTPREALRILLTGTGLVVRYNRSNAGILIRAASPADGALLPLGRVVVREHVLGGFSQRERFKSYYLILESELRNYLRNDPATSQLSFDRLAQIRIDDEGRIIEIRLDEKANDNASRKIVSALSGRAVTRPPSELDQPLDVALKARR